MRLGNVVIRCIGVRYLNALMSTLKVELLSLKPPRACYSWSSWYSEKSHLQWKSRG